MINDTSQHSAATWFRCGGTSDQYFITDLLLSLSWKNFFNHSTFGKVMGKKSIAANALSAGTLSCWKMKNSLEIWCMAGSHCCNSIILRFRDWQVSNWCNVNHLLLADWCYQWLNLNCVHRRFVTTSFFLVDGDAFSCHSMGFKMWSLWISFRQWTKMMLTSPGEHFWATVLHDSLAWKFASLSSGSLRFLSINISQGSVVTRLRCGGVLHYWFATNLLLDVSVKEFWKAVSI